MPICASHGLKMLSIEAKLSGTLSNKVSFDLSWGFDNELLCQRFPSMKM
jgi:hypothetical protein